MLTSLTVTLFGDYNRQNPKALWIPIIILCILQLVSHNILSRPMKEKKKLRPFNLLVYSSVVTILITAVTSGSIATTERSAGIAVDPVWVVALHLQQRDLEVVSNQTNHEMEEHAQLCGKFYLYCVSIVYQIRLGHHILVGCHHLRYLHLRKSSKPIIAPWK